ncbi:flagellar hook-associated protein FlgK [Sphingomonas hylomeconis]|uniref:Flagellar hook-associated protein 1 n=1 Tax=Sphingomonas hylomeconis TaxID=1395958 RepID=A0ABV7SS36_9SPHN|nr:flagellar hook-associated protein FlgK [Sphingomonas hylomeconis]
MSDLLGIGASGVRAYQSALTTVSENIANAATTGYARRAVQLSEVGASGGSLTQRNVVSGSGVLVSGVARSADAFRAADVRAAGADLARSETAIGSLGAIQTALTGNQLGNRLTSFFNATKAVAADPSASTPRQAMLESATAVAQAFTGTGKQLDAVAAELDVTATEAAAGLDGLGASLAKINDALGRTQPGTAGAAQLADQRDQLLEQMSAISDVSVVTDAAGRATVRLGGAAGPVFVAGSEAGHVSYVRNEEGAVSFAVERAGTNSTLSPNGGVLAGIAEGVQRVAAARDQLNTLATTFVDGINAVQAQGQDLDGGPGAAMFAAGATPSDVSMVLRDPRGLAAAAAGGGARDNSNLAKFETLRNSSQIEAGVTALVAGNASALSGKQAVAEAQGAIRDNAVAALDSATGVNLDSEAVDLLRFQQAYQASARIIQVARETMQSILDIR